MTLVKALMLAASAAASDMSSHVSPMQACFFVATRFLHESIWDKLGTRRLIYIRPDGSFSFDSDGGRVFSCDEAKEFMIEYLRDMSKRVPHEKATYLPADTHERTLQRIKEVSWGLSVDLKELMDALARSSFLVWSEASTNWLAWYYERHQLHPGRGKKAVESHLREIEELIWRAVTSPSWSPQMHLAVANCAFYYLDLTSLGDIIEDAGVWRARALLAGTAPGFRRWEGREVREDLSIAPGATWQAVWRWDNSETLRSKALRQAIITTVCGDPVSWLDSHQNMFYFLRLATNLMDLCSGRSRKDQLEAVATMATASWRRASMRFQPAHLGSALYLYLNRENAAGGLPEKDPREKRSRAGELLARVVEECGMVVSNIGGNSRIRLILDRADSRICYGALGVALGLAIRHAVPVSQLGLDPKLWGLLHPRVRSKFNRSGLNAVASELGYGASESDAFVIGVKQVSHGLDDALGPGGFALFNDSQWSQLMSSN